MGRRILGLMVVLLLAAPVLAQGNTEPPKTDSAKPGTFSWQTQRRVETAAGSGLFHTVVKKEQWQADQTAVIVCDMWDLHHCLNATRRGAEMAPRMNALLAEARKRGALVIHAPSSCMAAYEGQPARVRAQQAPKAPDVPNDIGKWCYKIPAEEKGTYPIDQSDGGEDDDPAEHQAWAEKLKTMGRNPRAPWKSQSDLLTIDQQRDCISDNGVEIWNLLHQHGIKNVVMVGVHTNMCVLGRPFGLRQMAKNDKNVVLVRDLTDTMYNPQRAPYVSHFTGTDLIVEHIEKWVCPTVTSDQLLGGRPHRFKNDTRPHVVIVTAEREYKTEQTLPKFALSHLGKEFRVSFVFAAAENRNSLLGLERLRDADVALISVRRRVPTKHQMQAIRQFVQSGKPIVGIRTANHAFSLRGKTPPAGHVAWENFDRQILGGNYSGHHGNGPKVQVEVAKGAEGHPILDGVDASQIVGHGSLYKVSPLQKDALPLLLGTIDGKPTEPLAWTHRTPAGGRVFYTSLGHTGDFAQPAVNRLLVNAIRWANSSKRTTGGPKSGG